MEWRLEPSYLEMHLPSFLPQMITERPPAGGQAQGSRMGPGEGQDTDAPNGELHCVMCNRAEGLFSCLVERVWWSGKVAREHSSVCMVREVKSK